MVLTDDIKQLMDSELSLAGRDTDEVLKQRRMESLRITPETVVKERRFLFTLFGTPCFPRGELVAITGKKKCGKTFFCSLLMSLCSIRENMSMTRIEKQQLRTVWIDTEQSEESTKEILVNRIYVMAGEGNENLNDNANLNLNDNANLNPNDNANLNLNDNANLNPNDNGSGNDDRYFAYNLRSVTWNERMDLVAMAIEKHRPDLVIFDGIRDVVDDINNGVMAQEVLERCMNLASTYECCICCVLHQNKSLEDKTLRGALGTELGNKSFEEYELKKDSEHRLISVEQVSTRKYDIMSKLCFTVGDDGLPHQLSVEEQQKAIENAQKQDVPSSSYNPEYVKDGKIDYIRAFDKILPDDRELRAFELEQQFMNLVKLKSSGLYADLRNKALKEEIIARKVLSFKNVYYLRGPKLDENKPF